MNISKAQVMINFPCQGLFPFFFGFAVAAHNFHANHQHAVALEFQTCTYSSKFRILHEHNRNQYKVGLTGVKRMPLSSAITTVQKRIYLTSYDANMIHNIMYLCIK